MNRFLIAGLAGLSLALAGTAAADAATVTVRAEGETGPLVRAVDVDPSGVGQLTRGSGMKQGSCAGNTGAGALDLATGGAWDADYYSFANGFFITGIKDLDYRTASDRGWAYYVNDVAPATGICEYVPQDGDELVFAPQCYGGTAGCYDGAAGLLSASAGAVTRLGQPVAVSVVQAVADSSGGVTRSPAAGVTVTGGGVSATTGADGIARLTLTQRGPVELRATSGLQVPDETTSCVTDGADGYCGTVSPNGTTLPASVGGSAGPTGVKDTTAPQAAIANIGEGRRFSRKKAPRRLEAKVSDPSGILQVKLSLTRQVGKRCSWFSGKSERFVEAKCGTRHPFKIGDRGDVSYLLPKRLGKGRYVFDVLTTDRAYNRDKLARGRNRIVFTVR